MQRYLENVPILARPASTLYQMRMFARRNRSLVAALAAVVIALVGGALGIVNFAVGQSRALAEARRQTEIAHAVNDFLNHDVLEAADPWTGADPGMTVREAVADASRAVDARFAGQPHVEAAVHLTLGRTLRHLGDYGAARMHVERALELRQRELGGDHAEVAEAMVELATIMSVQGEYPESEAVHRDVLTMQRRLLSPDDPALLASTTRMAVIHIAKGEFDDAETLIRSTLAAARRARRLEDVATGTHWLAYLLASTGREPEAEPLCREALALRRQFYGHEHPKIAASMVSLGRALRALERFDEAEALLRDAVAMREKYLGPDQSQVVTAKTELGALLAERGQLDEARSTLEWAVAHRRRSKPGHVDCSIALYELGRLRATEDDLAPAERLFREALAVQKAQLNTRNPFLADTQIALGELLVRTGRADEGEPFLRAGLATREQTLVPGAVRLAFARGALGACLVTLGRCAEAEPLARAAHDRLRERRGAVHRDTLVARRRLVTLYERWNRPEQAAAYR